MESGSPVPRANYYASLGMHFVGVGSLFLRGLGVKSILPPLLGNLALLSRFKLGSLRE